MVPKIDCISLYICMRRELSPEERQQIHFLQKENNIIVIESDDIISFCNNGSAHDCSGYIADNVFQEKICISDDYYILKDAYKAGWAVIVYLDKLTKTQEKTIDSSFVQFAIDSLYAIDKTYLHLVYCRCKGIPRLITQTDRLLIREMTLSDIDDLIEIFESNEKTDFFEPFYGSREEAEIYLSSYTNDVYRFYDYGIWGAYLKECDKMIGIAGFTPRPGTDHKPVLELGYAVAKSYQGHGYAKEACKAVVTYARKELEYDEIIKITSKGRQIISS